MARRESRSNIFQFESKSSSLMVEPEWQQDEYQIGRAAAPGPCGDQSELELTLLAAILSFFQGPR